MLDVALALIVGRFEGRADSELFSCQLALCVLSDHQVVAAGCEIHELTRSRRILVHELEVSDVQIVLLGAVTIRLHDEWLVDLL